MADKKKSKKIDDDFTESPFYSLTNIKPLAPSLSIVTIVTNIYAYTLKAFLLMMEDRRLSSFTKTIVLFL